MPMLLIVDASVTRRERLLTSRLPHVLYRRAVLIALLALIFLAFFGTLVLSARMFPPNYDWRYRVISNLLSPRDNPSHYWLPALRDHDGRGADAAVCRIFTSQFGDCLAARCPRNCRSIDSWNRHAHLRVHGCATTRARCVRIPAPA
jgi:hypothetical protein